MSQAKDPITTHVLDQTTGKPAGGIKATLKIDHSTAEVSGEDGSDPSWTGVTSAEDGRINSWSSNTFSTLSSLSAMLGNTARDSTVYPLVFSLELDTGSYWRERGVDFFHPKVVVHFSVTAQDERKHWHVPVLLGPYGYTTYRGS